jgi:hypothetical protein
MIAAARPAKAKKPVMSFVAMEGSLRKLLPRDRDPELAFAAAMAGRRYREGATHDAGHDLDYIRKFRPQPHDPSSPEHWLNFIAAAVSRWARDGDPEYADIAEKLASKPRVGRPPLHDTSKPLTPPEAAFVRAMRAGASPSGAAKILGFHRNMGGKLKRRPHVAAQLCTPKFRDAA